jgi:DNA-binding NtrC family response regulator/tetratricopeptide (TPR) repeat protein
MARLLVDRFVCSEAVPPIAGQGAINAVDTATGERVALRISPAGTHVEQQRWVERCASVSGEIDPECALIDFGFIGVDRRFEAIGRRADASLAAPDPPLPSVMEWLEEVKPSSARILHLAAFPNARELRLRGFIPVKLSLLQGGQLAREILRLTTGRSVALLADRPDPAGLSLAFLRLLRTQARDVCALVHEALDRPALVTRAAEGRAVFEAPPARRFTLRGGASVADARASGLLDAGARLLQNGRHAAAERALRSAMAAFDRRGNLIPAADAGVRLGRLLMDRGRAGDARPLLEAARDRFQRVRAPAAAVIACAYSAVAQTDLGLLDEADRAHRAAYSAASALGEPEPIVLCVVALARNLFWQGRYADATAILESVTPAGEPEVRARYWCLIARLRLNATDLPGARRAVERARAIEGPNVDSRVEALIRTSEAAIQARLGDIEALVAHVKAGTSASRLAHLPLHALRLRLTLIEGLLDAGRTASGRALGRHLKPLGKEAIPGLLKSRIDRVIERLTHAEPCNSSHRPMPSACESVARFHLEARNGSVGDIDSLTHLVSLCHDLEDEHEVLRRAAAAIRKQTHALGVAIFGCSGTETLLFGAAGTVNDLLARRSIDLGQPIHPELAVGGVEAAIPIRYLGRVIGALASRWSIEGPENAGRVMACGAAAAAVCAPLVHVRLESAPAAVLRPAGASDLAGISSAVEDVRRAVARAANAPFTVLIEGESGSGKELVARAVHRAGSRRERPFCALNCAAMPEDLVDAELFGHAKGAFTGAAGERVGLFEGADGGTVFLDEVGELSPRAQAKLLRVLQEGEIRRIGENFTRPIEARLVAATNRSLRAEAEAGRFRKDLLYRLDVIRIVVPPLRDRVEDIPLLAARFWRQCTERIGSKAVLGRSALSVLARYDWPGNVRELQNVLTGLAVAGPSRGVVGASAVPAAIARAVKPLPDQSLHRARFEFEQRFVGAALARTAGHRGRTATALGLSRQGLAKLMQRLHLE